mmetsp:Transcript_58230/g.134443  ORF Transcript_58230/g.134443 Transcript_58230/m.134443 type:complete len:374 (-) Transcript_58230:310-1431(-)|eukprot:CAMPEP_0204254456 /NCGR_PEP_ID=MMETSP0468-20130131/2547_1 /ASSEMBLY_ACC=CAM_ASM_000383 /TAXON_ID=2969 /ORGANISM="Oxyrrhis marina" /LENGTH=373 /DNA_ID=CAMNT_0051228193 /DNA_START=42 /DNA_END=1163 /DNA_ORIENTATION=+
MPAKRNASSSAASKAKVRKVVDPVVAAVEEVCKMVEKAPATMSPNLVVLTARKALPLVKEDRTWMHSQVLDWVRQALAARKAAIEAEQKEVQGTIADVDLKRAAAAKVMESAKAVLETKTAANTAATEVLSTATAKAKEEASKVKPIVKQKNAADTDLKNMEEHLANIRSMKESLATAFHECDKNSKQAADKIVSFLKKAPAADASLSVSAAGVLAKKAADLSQFEVMTRDYIGKFLDSSAAQAEKDISEQKTKIATICESMADNVSAQKALEETTAASEKAKGELKDAQTAVRESTDKCDQIERDFISAEANREVLVFDMEMFNAANAAFDTLLARSSAPPPEPEPVAAPPAVLAATPAAEASLPVSATDVI